MPTITNERLIGAYNILVKLNIIQDLPIEENTARFTDEFNNFRFDIGKDPLKMQIIADGIDSIKDDIFPDVRSDLTYKTAMTFLISFCAETNRMEQFLALNENEQVATFALLAALTQQLHDEIVKSKTSTYIV
jgi:hypothetical protein